MTHFIPSWFDLAKWEKKNPNLPKSTLFFFLLSTQPTNHNPRPSSDHHRRRPHRFLPAATSPQPPLPFLLPFFLPTPIHCRPSYLFWLPLAAHHLHLTANQPYLPTFFFSSFLLPFPFLSPVHSPPSSLPSLGRRWQ